MKKIIAISLAALIAVPFFVGCKKGEEDPFLSLKSRNKRLVGEWKAVAFDMTTTTSEYEKTSTKADDTYQEDRTETTTFDGTKVTTKVVTDYRSVNATTVTATTTHTSYDNGNMSLTINEDGTSSISWSSTNNTTPGTFVITSSPANSADNFINNNPYSDWTTCGSCLDDGTYNEDIDNDYTANMSYTETAAWYWIDQTDDKSGVGLPVLAEMSDVYEFEIVKLSSKELKLKVTYSYDSNNNSAYSGTWNFAAENTDSFSTEQIWTFEKQ